MARPAAYGPSRGSATERLSFAAEAAADRVRKATGQRVDELAVLALDHDPDDGLGARGAQDDAPALAELGFDAIDRTTHCGIAIGIHGLTDFDVEQDLRELAHASREVAQRPPRASHHGEDLQRRDQPVTRRSPIEAYDVARR